MDRLVANRSIVAVLAVEVEKHPDFRFHQLLESTGLVKPGEDRFYEESEKTLQRLQSRGLGI